MNARSRKQNLIADINITPFTDVVLVLLIIFMITTPLIMQSGIKVDLPNATSATPTNKTTQVEVTITNENLVYLDDQLITRRELKQKLSSLHNTNSELEVILLSDKMVKFKDIVAVLDILNGLGIKNLNIAAKQED